MTRSYQAAPDIDVLTTSIPIANLGKIPINAFVLQGAEPVLVDTGVVGQQEQFVSALRLVIDPTKLRFIWLTHTDPDHIGALHKLLDENPKLRVVTTFLGVGIMGLFAPLPMDRVYLLNPGEKLALADRTLTAWKPPAFDNPSTTGFYDDKTRALVSSDCFGALLADPPDSAAELGERELREGQTLWTTIDSPWIHKVDKKKLGEELEAIRRMEPAMILSSHLPAASAKVSARLLANLEAAPAAEPFVGPNQAALEQMLTQMAS